MGAGPAHPPSRHHTLEGNASKETNVPGHPPIGPQLPPHLKKRSLEDGEPDKEKGSPEGEPATKRPRTIGPALPPHLAEQTSASKDDEVPEKDAEEESTSPVRLPHQSQPNRRIGPAPPPAPLEERPPESPSNGKDDSSDDDDYGPTLPGSEPADSSRDTKSKPSTQHWDKNAPVEIEADTGPKKRDEWMMLPPDADGLSARMDPLKQKSRGFNMKPTSNSKGGLDTKWTETAEEKRQRLENEVLGISSAPASNKSGQQAQRPVSKEASDAKEKKKQGPSLYEQHQKSTKKEKGDDPSARAFDYEKDMGVSSGVAHKQRRQMVANAKDMGGRFSKGQGLD